VQIKTLLFFIIFFLLNLSKCYSQNKNISLDLEDAHIEEVFNEIQKNTEFKIFYMNSEIDLQRKISIQVDKKSIEKILKLLFADTNIVYEIVGKQILLKRASLKNKSTPISSVNENTDLEEVVLEKVQVQGTIVDAFGVLLSGVNVIEKGTTNGTSSDFDGNYTLSVASTTAVLEFSSLGFITKEVEAGNQTTINVFLLEDSESLDKIVITAFGFEKKIKSVGYSITQVKGDELNRVKTTSPLQALRGKIAGVNISNSATGIKGSTRVVIRGNSSFNGANQPLYIIDGISLQNQQLGSAGEWGGADNGDGLSAINPDDIKSISVLKGGAAAALYGSRASNGVIIIKTKDGKGGQKGMGIEVSNQTVFTGINNLFNPQTTYGNGIAGGFTTNQADTFNSWGPRLDGSLRTTYDGSQQVYAYAGDNLKRLYSTSLNTTNSVAFTSNTDKGSTRLSTTYTDGKDVVATSKLKRLSFALNTSQRLSDKLTVSASVKFSDIDETANPVVGTAPMSPNGAIRYFAPNINVNDFIGDFGNGTTDGRNELRVSDGLYNTNPWFALHNNITSAEKQRLLGAVNARYDVTKNLYIRGQAGFDKATNHFNNQVLNGAPLFQPGVAYYPGGQLFQQTQTIDQYDADVFIGTDNVNVTKDFAVNGFVGAGTFYVKAENVGVFGNQMVIPGLISVLNTASQSGLYGFQERKINSVYGSAEFSFLDKIYLTTTVRNDWFSTLSAPGKTTPNSDLYGSASLSVILSDLIELPTAISFAKIRGGYSQVAGGANDPYGLSLTYGLVGQGHLGTPLGNINGGTIPNSSITPFEKNEMEVGLDLRLLNNRFSLDLAYYSNQTLRDIVNTTSSIASGYQNTTINLGEITNKGVEILLRGKVIDKDDFSLDLSLNYANNRSEVVRTDENNGIIQAGVGSFFQSNIGHMPGQPFGVIYGNSYVRDAQGSIVHEMVNGIPVPKSEALNKVLGVGVAPTQMGFGVDLRYKSFTFNAFLEGKFGGSIVSNTNQKMKQYGLHEDTVPQGGRENGFIPDGVLEDGSLITQRLTDGDIYSYWTLGSKHAIGEENVYKNDFIRISQLSLAYQIPNKALMNTFINSASISVVGNNLGFIFNNVPNHDPEAYYNTRNGQGAEAISMPIGESVGFSINLKF
jgi:TonB-linked SusC/RagA family outer membrane protein